MIRIEIRCKIYVVISCLIIYFNATAEQKYIIVKDIIDIFNYLTISEINHRCYWLSRYFAYDSVISVKQLVIFLN